MIEAWIVLIVSAAAALLAHFLNRRQHHRQYEPQPPHWEVVSISKGSTISGYRVQWSQPDECGSHFTVGRAYKDQFTPLSQCELEATEYADRLNMEGKTPETIAK